MPTLPEFIAVERDQCRRLARDFDLLGSTGAFGAALIQDAVGRAEAAVRAGEPEAMQTALVELRRVATLRCNSRAMRPAAPMPPVARGYASYSQYVNAH